MPKRKNKVPDRWEKYEPFGTPLEIKENAQILAFKVPLCDAFSRKLKEAKPFSLQDLFRDVKNLALVIDLTNTDRYYNKKDITDKDVAIDGKNIKVQYKKIKIPGKRLPSEESVTIFKETVSKFLEVTQSKSSVIIGVHCTHGLNRTGYMVCRYLIDCLKYEPDEAIKTFNDMRHHEMERYCDDLRQMPLKTHVQQHSAAYNGQENVKPARPDSAKGDCKSRNTPESS
uniref:RNA/RNP complex-1-interacting phosphatase-like n=1 Tax=Saccoglossus kowalevskii TaxID=10224 RepID=A0ABM0MNA9_SACKO